MHRIEEGAAGERARVCSRPDGKAGLDSGHQSSPVLSWFFIWPCVANVVAESKVHVSMRFVGSFCSILQTAATAKTCTFSDNLSRNSCIQILLFLSICYTKEMSQTIFSLKCYIFAHFINL